MTKFYLYHLHIRIRFKKDRARKFVFLTKNLPRRFETGALESPSAFRRERIKSETPDIVPGR